MESVPSCTLHPSPLTYILVKETWAYVLTNTSHHMWRNKINMIYETPSKPWNKLTCDMGRYPLCPVLHTFQAQ